MAGTREGGLKAAARNKELNKDFYVLIGRKGGKISRGGGFTGNPELARINGIKGGQVSRKSGPNEKKMVRDNQENVPTRFDAIKSWFK